MATYNNMLAVKQGQWNMGPSPGFPAGGPIPTVNPTYKPYTPPAAPAPAAPAAPAVKQPNAYDMQQAYLNAYNGWTPGGTQPQAAPAPAAPKGPDWGAYASSIGAVGNTPELQAAVTDYYGANKAGYASGGAYNQSQSAGVPQGYLPPEYSYGVNQGTGNQQPYQQSTPQYDPNNPQANFDYDPNTDGVQSYADSVAANNPPPAASTGGTPANMPPPIAFYGFTPQMVNQQLAHAQSQSAQTRAVADRNAANQYAAGGFSGGSAGLIDQQARDLFRERAMNQDAATNLPVAAMNYNAQQGLPYFNANVNASLGSQSNAIDALRALLGVMNV